MLPTESPTHLLPKGVYIDCDIAAPFSLMFARPIYKNVQLYQSIPLNLYSGM